MAWQRLGATACGGTKKALRMCLIFFCATTTYPDVCRRRFDLAPKNMPSASDVEHEMGESGRSGGIV